jgi:DNA-binding NtrC family response regulator
VIVITGAITQETADQARASGAFDIVEKPFDLDVLKSLLGRAMALAPRE